MRTKAKTALLALLCFSVFLLTGACQNDSAPSNSISEVPSGLKPNASVSGSVTYRERLLLTPDATLVVELRDVTYADGDAPLIARQTISEPGQVPIKFNVEYNREDINSRNVYSLQTSIFEADGRLAFVNDTTYEVITRGNPHKADILMVLVEPPPELMDGVSNWRNWVEVPAPIVSANLIPGEAENFLRVVYHQSNVEGCARPGNQELEVDGHDINVRLTLMQPPPTPWRIPCDEQLVELDVVETIESPIEPGQTYRVIVNGQETTTLAWPEARLGHTSIASSPIESADIEMLERAPPQYQMRVISGMPKGSGCSQFNGYEIQRGETNVIDVMITHHEVGDPFVACTTDYPVVETIVILGSDFEPGTEYTVRVNSDTTASFIAQ